MKGNCKIEFLFGLLLVVTANLSGKKLPEIQNNGSLEKIQYQTVKNCTSNCYLITINEELVIEYDTIFPDFKNLRPYRFSQNDSFLLEIIDEYELAYTTWRYYKIKYGKRGRIKGHIRKLYTIFAIDKDNNKAYKLEVIVKYEKIRRGKYSQEGKRGRFNFKIRIKRKSNLDYKVILNKFLIAEELQFHNLDQDQLYNKSGPVNENGLAKRYEWTHMGNTEVLLKSKDTIGIISSYAPKRLYNLFPKMYPDRGKFLLVYELFQE